MKCFAQISLAVLALGCACMSLTPHAQAQDIGGGQGVQGSDAKVMDLRDALRELFRTVNVSYTIAPEVQGTVIYRTRNVTFETSLQDLLKQANATYRIEAGVYMIVARPTIAPGSQQNVEKVDIDNMDVRQVIRTLFKNAKLSYSIAPEVQGTVTLSLRNVTFEVAIQNVLRQVDATYGYSGGTYHIVKRQSITLAQPDPVDNSLVIKSVEAPPTMTVDGRFLYILKGSQLYKVDKNTLELVKTGSILGAPSKGAR